MLTEDAQAVDGRFAGFTMSPHEECAVELAVQMAAATGGEADGAHRSATRTRSSSCAPRWRSAAPPPRWSRPSPSTFGPADVAREIAAVVRDHEAAGARYDLVLLGNDAADSGDFQVGIRLGLRAGRPVVNGASTVTVEDGPEGPVAAAAGKGPHGQETYRVPLPAVVTVPRGSTPPSRIVITAGSGTR